jgi:DNA-binding CsgD family transcriptional regulator
MKVKCETFKTGSLSGVVSTPERLARAAKSFNLSTRQLQILTCAALGFPRKQTADLLGLSVSGVDYHLDRLFTRLRCRCVTGCLGRLLLTLSLALCVAGCATRQPILPPVPIPSAKEKRASGHAVKLFLPIAPPKQEFRLLWNYPADLLPVVRFTVQQSFDLANWQTVSNVIGTACQLPGTNRAQFYRVGASWR